MSRIQICLAFVSAVALATALAPPASAGTYTVRSCWAGELDGWEPVNGVPPLWAINSCNDSTLAPKTGIGGAIAESNGIVPNHMLIGWQFTAPPGTRITGLSGEVSSHGNDSGRIARWAPGFWNRYDPNEMQSYELGSSWTHFDLGGISWFGIGLGLNCMSTSCLFPPADELGDANDPYPQYGFWLAARRLIMTITDDQKPAITVTQQAPSGWRRDGSIPVSITADDNVGVSSLRILVDKKEFAKTIRDCYPGPEYNVLARPCSGPGATLSTTLNITDEGVHQIALTARDVATNESVVTAQVSIDRSAPGAPRALRLSGTQEWRRDNRFDVSWGSPPDDGLAPTDQVEYELCPAANPPDNFAGCVWGNRNGRDPVRISDVAVPSSGEWRLRIALRDTVGNLDWDRSAVLEPLRYDGDLPSAAFLPFDAFDPARVQLAAGDDTSGVAAVEIEARRQGDSAWHTLSIERSGDRYSAPLDDNQLLEGLYELRAHVTDRAGNERTTTRFAGGAAAEIRLPVRTATAIAVGEPHEVKVKSSKGKRPTIRRVLVREPVAGYGEPVSIEGALADPVGNPRAGATIQVLERVSLPGRDWQHLAELRTDGAGKFKFRAQPGPARVLRFVYQGTATTRPRTEDVELRVRAGVSLTPSRRRVRNGSDVVFRGRVLGGPIPEAGKLLAIQALTSRGWRTFATPRARATDGRWSYRYRFLATPVTSRYSFRVVVPEESSYPYASGTSKVAHVLVRGGA